jgi:hypothetical protein
MARAWTIAAFQTCRAATWWATAVRMWEGMGNGVRRNILPSGGDASDRHGVSFHRE